MLTFLRSVLAFLGSSSGKVLLNIVGIVFSFFMKKRKSNQEKEKKFEDGVTSAVEHAAEESERLSQSVRNDDEYLKARRKEDLEWLKEQKPPMATIPRVFKVNEIVMLKATNIPEGTFVHADKKYWLGALNHHLQMPVKLTMPGKRTIDIGDDKNWILSINIEVIE